MDEISLLNRVRADIPARSPDDVIRGRAALLRAMQAPPAPDPARRPRQRWIWVGSAAAATCALTGAIVFGGALGAPVGADPAAAAVLGSAATAARSVVDPVVGPGQYLEVRTDAVYSAMGTTEADAEVARRERDGNLEEGDMTGFLESSVQALWVPSERSGDWIEVRCARTPVQTFGPRSETLVAEWEASGVNDRYVFPAGKTEYGAPITMFDADTAADLPRDPRQLLERIYRDNGNAGPSRDGEALVWIADRLRSGTVPAELRSLFYDTAALIPGVTITEEQATLNGRTGTAIGRDEGQNGFRQDIIIDPETGAFIGERQVLLRPVADMPAGTATGSTSVTTTVVDAAPEGTSLCAG
ncbi:CU044_5270 family protein [Microbacterium sp. NPDC090007]|uniref:CU044_5270 family protein n=1 Tax=Microbacterium sp. NPDC090007 TaxID=3364204 RepID=UPI0037F6596E